MGQSVSKPMTAGGGGPTLPQQQGGTPGTGGWSSWGGSAPPNGGGAPSGFLPSQRYGGFTGFQNAWVPALAQNNPQAFQQMMGNAMQNYATNHAANFGMINPNMPAPSDNRYYPWMLQGFTSQQGAQAAAPAPLNAVPANATPAAQGGIGAFGYTQPGGYAFDWQAGNGGGAG